MMRVRTAVLVMATTILGWAVSCESSDDETKQACVPGKQESCACPAGALGVQACKEDGSGFEPCACEGATGAGGSGSTTGSTTTGSGGAGGAGGGGSCTPDYEPCTLAEDCCSGVCNGADDTCGCSMIGEACVVDEDCCGNFCDVDSFCS